MQGPAADFRASAAPGGAAPAPSRMPYRREGGTVLIELSLRRLPQLFNSFDPSPFHERDLDPEADAWLVGAAEEIGAHPIRLVIHLPPAECAGADAGEVARAIHHYFAYRLLATRRAQRQRFAEGRLALAVGVGFLLGCVTLRQFVLSASAHTLALALAEGLVILGWVAMWGPLQIFLYDWLPRARAARTLRRLAAMPVELRASAD